MNGMTGHRHCLVGLGDRGIVPSLILIPGKLAKRLSGLSASSAALLGKMMMVYWITIPFLPLDVLDSWHSILAEKPVMPASATASPNATLLSAA